MKRSLFVQLSKWKSRTGRKPLLLQGARQVGKTWLLKDFGRLEFRKTHYVDFENVAAFRSLFHTGLRPVMTALRNPRPSTGCCLGTTPELRGAVHGVKAHPTLEMNPLAAIGPARGLPCRCAAGLQPLVTCCYCKKLSHQPSIPWLAGFPSL